MNAFAGTGALVRLLLRLDRVRLPVWILAIIGIVYASASAVGEAYSTPEQVQSYADTMGTSPAAIAMAGPPFALDTIGGILVYETSITALVAVALMAIFLVLRHTRTEEELGRTEVLGSTVVGRHAPLAAAVGVVSAASVLVGAGVAAALASTGAGTGGAVLFGAAVATFGVFFTAVAAVCAQLTEHARSAIGIASAALGLSFILRALGDIRDGTLSWLSPMGWSQQVAAFSDDQRWWPLALSLACSVLLGGVAARLLGRRDLGAGLLPQRPGPERAAESLAGPGALASRLQRGSLIGWTAGVFVAGAAFGAFSREVQQMVDSNPTFAEYFSAGSGATLVESFFATALLIVALLATGFAVSSVLQLRSEETSGRVEPLLSTPLSRSRWFLGTLSVTLVGIVAVLAAGGFGLGLTYGLVEDDLSSIPRLTAYALAYLPAVLLVAALTAALVGWLPRLAAPLGWAILAVCFVVGWLGDVLDLPATIRDVSPLNHVPAVPADDLALLPLLILIVLAVVAVGAARTGLLRRDVG